MKKLLILIVFSNYLFGFSQDWKCIKTNSISYFSVDSTDIHAIQIDSSYIAGDTVVYYPFKMLRKDSAGYYRELGDNWVGRKIKVLSNGDNIFYNSKYKSIILKTKANLFEAWTCYMYPGGSYIEARINSLDISQFLGQSDSVKTIVFQLKDKSGTSILNQADSCRYINSSVLLLSKNHGLIKIIDFYKFPISNLNDLEDIYGSDYQYNLIGQTNPSIGYKKLTTRDFYDFNIGDEIHWNATQDVNGYDRINGTNYSYWYKTQYIDKVIAKNIAADDSSVNYTFYRMSKKTSSQNFDIKFLKDTVTQTYFFYSTQYINPDLYEPLEPFYSRFFVHNTLTVKEYYIDDPATIDEIYYKNAGFYYTNRSHPTPWESLVDKYTIQYFTHGNYSWGTPLNFQADEIATTELYVYPNPVNDILYFKKANNANAIVMIFDFRGKQILKKVIESNFIDLSDLLKGFYIIKVAENESIRFSKFIKE